MLNVYTVQPLAIFGTYMIMTRCAKSKVQPFQVREFQEYVPLKTLQDQNQAQTHKEPNQRKAPAASYGRSHRPKPMSLYF